MIHLPRPCRYRSCIRQWLTGALFGVLFSSLQASEPLAAPTPAANAVRPNRLRHARETQACEQRVAAMAGKRCDLIFIGDSITQAWESVGRATWQRYYADRHALNFGVSGDRTEDVLWRLDHFAVGTLHPRVAVVLIGTNQVNDAPAAIAQGVENVLKRTQTRFPDAKIVLVSILPNARARDKMAAVNPLIQRYADNRRIFYLDLLPQFSSSGDSWRGLGPDRLHPSAEGYELWAAGLEPLLRRFGV